MYSVAVRYVTLSRVELQNYQLQRFQYNCLPIPAAETVCTSLWYFDYRSSERNLKSNVCLTTWQKSQLAPPISYLHCIRNVMCRSMGNAHLYLQNCTGQKCPRYTTELTLIRTLTKANSNPNCCYSDLCQYGQVKISHRPYKCQHLVGCGSLKKWQLTISITQKLHI